MDTLLYCLFFLLRSPLLAVDGWFEVQEKKDTLPEQPAARARVIDERTKKWVEQQLQQLLSVLPQC
jgi:hypothetical protein